MHKKIFSLVFSLTMPLMIACSPILKDKENFNLQSASFSCSLSTRSFEKTENYYVFYLLGEINICTSYWFHIAASEFLKSDLKRFVVYISSPGGEYYSTLSLVNDIYLMKKRGREVIGIVNGIAHSGAALVFLSIDSDKRFVYPKSTFMLHMIEKSPDVKMDEILEKRLERLREDYLKTLSQLSGLPKNKILDLMNKELFTEEVLSLGLARSVDELIFP